MRKWLPIGAAIILALVISQARDWLMYNFNYQIDHLSRGTDFSYAHSFFQSAVGSWELSTLVACKWLSAMLIVLIMLLLTVYVARRIFGSGKYDRALVTVYLASAIISLTFYFLSTFNPNFRMAGVQLLHALQYPVVLFVLILASPLANAPRAAE